MDLGEEPGPLEGAHGAMGNMEDDLPQVEDSVGWEEWLQDSAWNLQKHEEHREEQREHQERDGRLRRLWMKIRKFRRRFLRHQSVADNTDRHQNDQTSDNVVGNLEDIMEISIKRFSYWHEMILVEDGRWLTLEWRHNERDGVLNHQPHDCLLNGLFRRRSKKTSKLRVTGHCAGNSPMTGEFPAQRASNAEKVFIWWRHHEYEIVESSCKNGFVTDTNIEFGTNM